MCGLFLRWPGVKGDKRSGQNKKTAFPWRYGERKARFSTKAPTCGKPRGDMSTSMLGVEINVSDWGFVVGG